MSPWDYESGIRKDPKYLRRLQDVHPARAAYIVKQWARGVTAESLATKQGLAVEDLRTLIARELKTLRLLKYRWKMAEANCRALGMELAYYRAFKDVPQDQPLELLDPPPKVLAVFQRAGILTINQIRCVDPEILAMRTGQDYIPRSAVIWMILALDELGLSHRLRVVDKNKSGYPRRAEYFELTGQGQEAYEKARRLHRIAGSKGGRALAAKRRAILGLPPLSVNGNGGANDSKDLQQPHDHKQNNHHADQSADRRR